LTFRNQIHATCVLLCALITPCLLGQDARGRIAVRVSDQSGSPVPRATVEAVQDGTGLKFSSTANEAGSYEILYLAPGTYSLAIHAQGFETVKQAGSDSRFEQGVLVERTLRW